MQQDTMTKNVTEAIRQEHILAQEQSVRFKGKDIDHKDHHGIVMQKTAINKGIDSDKSKAFVCNSTANLMEICIIQTLTCKDGRSTLIANCSKLGPDEENRLPYKKPGKAAGSCDVTVNEITIKKVATGETIVLNENSKPVTAKELFSYISGQKKGDILAGAFDSDCLAFDSKSGDFVLQQCN